MQEIFSDYRREAGFSTQEQFAEALNVGRSAVAKWETGLAYPHPLALKEIAGVLNKTEGEIIAAIKASKEPEAV